MPQKIIDTHVHIWNLEEIEYAWLKGDTSILNRTYSIDEINEERMQAGITEGVLVQAANNFEDTEWMLQTAEQTDWITGVVGWLPLTNPRATEKALTEHYLKNQYFKGVRHLIHNEEDHQWLLQKSVIESLKIITQYHLPYDVVGIIPDHIKTALQVAEKIPNLHMVFDHLNQPPIAAKEKFGVWGNLMKQAATNPNFYVKISGLGTASGNANRWTKEDITPYIEFMLQHFGADRCFCGGDWPVSLLAGNYTKTWKAYKDILAALLDQQGQEKVLFANAKTFYNL